MEKTTNDTELHCHYSDLPSPLAYDMDYDGMGNQGRVVKKTPKKDNLFTKILRIVKNNKG